MEGKEMITFQYRIENGKIFIEKLILNEKQFSIIDQEIVSENTDVESAIIIDKQSGKIKVRI